MQTYTHAVLGAALGATLFPDNLVLQGSCAVGAMVPDLVYVPQYLIDVAIRRKPLTTLSRRLLTVREVSHSIPFWTAAVMGMSIVASIWPNFLSAMAWSITIGGLTHPPIDVFTHNDPLLGSYGMLWPFRIRLRIGSWDYRKSHGDLTPKPFEVLVDCLALFTFVYLSF